MGNGMFINVLWGREGEVKHLNNKKSLKLTAMYTDNTHTHTHIYIYTHTYTQHFCK